MKDHYEFYQRAKFKEGKQFVKSIICSENCYDIIERRIESLNRNDTPWQLHKNGKMIQRSKST